MVKKYGKRTVVNDVSIELEQGEIVGLLGPNGAGKTTTFYMTTGLVAANNGKIFLNDQDINRGRTTTCIKISVQSLGIQNIIA